MNYTAEFREAVNDNFEVAVSNGIDANLVFCKSHIDNGISGYFTVTPQLTITLQAYRRDNGKEITHTIKVDDVKARDHIVVTLDVEEIDNTGNLEIGEGGITVDYQVNPKEEVIVVPGEGGSEGSGGESGGESGGDNEGSEGGEGEGGGDASSSAPVITGNGLDSPLYLTAEQAAETPVVDIIFITLEGKNIKDVWVKIDSPTLTEDFLCDMDLGAAEFSIVNFSNDDAGQNKYDENDQNPGRPVTGFCGCRCSGGVCPVCGCGCLLHAYIVHGIKLCFCHTVIIKPDVYFRHFLSGFDRCHQRISGNQAVG